MAVVMARKKHSARKGSRAMKRDAVPLSAIRRDDIVEEIVDHLRPWKNHKSHETVTSKVNYRIDVLSKLVPLQKKLSDRRAYREQAKKLDKALSNVEALLASTGNVPLEFIHHNADRIFSRVPYVERVIF